MAVRIPQPLSIHDPSPTLLFWRNIAQRILGHIFAREIAEFACLTGWRADGRVELSQTILGGSNFDFFAISLVLTDKVTVLMVFWDCL